MGGFITGGTPTAQYEASGYEISKAFDNNTSTFWYANHAPPCWIKYDLGAGNAKTMTEYRMKKRGTEYHTPTAWKLYGSNDDSDYTELDSQTGQSFSGVGYKVYTVAVTTEYRYYKLDISATISGTGVELAEFTAWNGRPDDAYTKSLLHFNDFDGSTDFYDECGKIWTAQGNAQIDTAQKKWTASGLFDGNGDCISASVSDDFKYDADFTVDCWIRPAAVDGIRTFYDCRTGSGSTSGFALFIESGYIKVYAGSRTITGLTPIAVDTWYHVAIARSGTATKLFLDGTQEGSTWTTSANFSDGNAIVGKTVDNQHYFSGHIDELRISKGIARWTSNFTPPTEEYNFGVVYYPPALTDTDTALAPSINHVFPGYLTDADTFFVPSINHVFPGTITDTDTFQSPVYNIALKMTSYITDTDTPVAPAYGRAIPLTLALTDTDILFAPELSGLPVPRHRMKVNWS